MKQFILFVFSLPLLFSIAFAERIFSHEDSCKSLGMHVQNRMWWCGGPSAEDSDTSFCFTFKEWRGQCNVFVKKDAYLALAPGPSGWHAQATDPKTGATLKFKLGDETGFMVQIDVSLGDDHTTALSFPQIDDPYDDEIKYDEYRSSPAAPCLNLGLQNNELKNYWCEPEEQDRCFSIHWDSDGCYAQIEDAKNKKKERVYEGDSEGEWRFNSAEDISKNWDHKERVHPQTISPQTKNVIRFSRIPSGNMKVNLVTIEGEVYTWGAMEFA